MTDPHCLAILADRTGLPVPGDLIVVEGDGYAAILGPAPRLRATRKALIQDAAARMARLERLMGCGTVIPTLPNVVMGSTLAERAIRANRLVLDTAARALRGRIQFQLSVACDVSVATDHFRSNPGGFGRVVSAPDLAARLGRFVDARLEALAAESIGLPVAEGVVVNRAILVPVDHQIALDGVLDEIDGLWTEGLTVRLTGPTPGVSHASLSMRLVSARDVKAALEFLSLEMGASVEAIGAARRRALLAGTSAERAGRMAAVLRLAEAAGWPDGPIPELALWSESRAAPAEAKGAA